MYQPGLLLLGALGLLIAGCSEDVLAPNDSELPEKLTPYESFLDLEILEQRRNDLIRRLPVDALVVIATNEMHTRNGSVSYEFRPASTFYYLTGFDEPYAAAIMKANATDPSDSDLIMFVEERGGSAVRWLGPTWGPEGAMEHFGADAAFSFGAIGSILNDHVATGRYRSVYSNLDVNEMVSDIFSESMASSLSTYGVDALVNEQRAVKYPNEIEAIRRAVDVSVQAFSEALDVIEPGMYEYEVDALFDYVLRINGSSRAAFPTIVASGPNTNVLHYEANQRQMLDGELVMIDFGAEYDYYASDLTRTLPVNGTFSAEQAAVYNIVREAHTTVLEAARPGVSYGFLYEMARGIALDGLISNGIVTGSREEIISSGRFRLYIPAGLAHCIGLDVHDPFPMAGADRILAENMVLAFEPHIYLSPDDVTVAADYRGISARIEDTVLITSSGAEVLSADLPIEIADIEARMDPS